METDNSNFIFRASEARRLCLPNEKNADTVLVPLSQAVQLVNSAEELREAGKKLETDAQNLPAGSLKSSYISTAMASRILASQVIQQATPHLPATAEGAAAFLREQES